MRRRIPDEKTRCDGCGVCYESDDIKHAWDNDALCIDCAHTEGWTVRVLDEAVKRIEACGASPELTSAVDIVSTFRHAYATKSPEYLLMVINNLRGFVNERKNTNK